MRWDAPGWMIGRRSWADRSYTNGWWWGRWGGECVTYSSSYLPDPWLTGYAHGLRDWAAAQ